MESDLANEDAAAVLRAVDSNVRSQRPLRELPGTAEQQWRAFVGTLLLRVEVDHALSLRVGHSEECRPRLTNPGLVVNTLSTLWGEVVRSTPAVARRQEVVLEMQLNAEGRVTEAKVVKGSGDRRADNVAHRAASLAIFQPALTNRRRSAVKVTFPVQFASDAKAARRGVPR